MSWKSSSARMPLRHRCSNAESSAYIICLLSCSGLWPLDPQETKEVFLFILPVFPQQSLMKTTAMRLQQRSDGKGLRRLCSGSLQSSQWSIEDSVCKPSLSLFLLLPSRRPPWQFLGGILQIFKADLYYWTEPEGGQGRSAVGRCSPRVHRGIAT